MNEINLNSRPNLKLSINNLKVTILHKLKMKRDETRIQNKTSKFKCTSNLNSIKQNIINTNLRILQRKLKTKQILKALN